MNRAQKVIVERGIRQLRYRISEQFLTFSQANIEERFPSAFLEAAMEVLDRMERRLACEVISAHPSDEAGQSVKPRPEPDTGRGVYLSGNNQKGN